MEVPELAAGDADEATGLATGAALDACVAIGAADTTGAEVAWLATGAGTVAKTPPGIPAADVVAFWVAFGEDAAAEVAPDPEPAVPVAPPATAFPQELPVGVANAVEVAPPSSSNESPGFGKITSVESWVPQPLLIFAINMSGRAL